MNSEQKNCVCEKTRKERVACGFAATHYSLAACRCRARSESVGGMRVARENAMTDRFSQKTDKSNPGTVHNADCLLRKVC